MADSHVGGAPYAPSAHEAHASASVPDGCAAKGGFLGRSRRLTRRSWALLIVVFLTVLVLVAPSPYVLETPGPTQDVLGSSGSKPVIHVTGGRSYQATGGGKLLLTTVNASGIPGSPASGLETLVAWLDPHATVLPQEVVFPPGQSRQDYVRSNRKDMTGSQDAAGNQALAFLRSRGADVSGVRLAMHVEDIGGPSAGLMYTLGAIDKLTPQDETGGQVIAGTGTMDKHGKVGRIGGINLKMLGAQRDGARWFLVPAGNCAEAVGHVPDGLRDVRVSTLSEAYDALTVIGQGRAGSLPHCSAGDSASR
ncbi:Lon protease [Bifidobacterium xylocopae]|uniref:Lon protease n=2 Tax=Bifidobacterium xylocopae TaxID=2493119 RepID=A0A366KBM8_9BIFI|nr:S16 family serine protease [Bifidobacterium xylocopae]RBP99084.1 Lon protease [Bifidobacterium xylocopae]